MFLSPEIDIKLCQHYTKMYICKILYKIHSIEQIIFNKYAANLKTTVSQRTLRNSSLLLFLFIFSNLSFLNSNLLLLLFEFNNLSFLIDILIILFMLPNMSPELQQMTLQYYCHESPSLSHGQNTTLPFEGILVTWYGRTDSHTSF